MGVVKLKKGQHIRPAILKAGFVALLLIAFAFALSFTQSRVAAAPQATAAASQTIQKLIRVGTSTIHSTPIGSGAYAAPEIDNQALGDVSGFKGAAAVPGGAQSAPLQRRANMPIPGKEAARHRLASSRIPTTTATERPQTLPLPEPVAESDVVVSFQGDGFEGFDGLSHVDQRLANNGNQFSLEPPDQGLCAGNGYVVETINDVIRVFDDGGNPLAGVEDMNSFFGLAAQVIRGTPRIVGPFISDPKCFYDRQTQRWFVTELMIDNGNNAGATGRSFNLIAVSQTSHPTGTFTVFMYDVTDDGLNGTPNHPGCPCFGDQPLLGADSSGVYQSTNEFGAGFNGAQLYAISKAGLVAAAESPSSPMPVVVQIDASQQLVPFGGLSYSIQPATSPGQGDNGNGIEYFLSALQFGNPGYEVYDNRIAVWALTNTSSLNSDTPNLDLSFEVVSSETYGQPDPAAQKAGETPLGTSLGDSEEFLNTNDDRMNQVVYANGLLYSGVNSKLSVGGASQTGLAWFAVQPSLRGSKVHGRVVGQGYVAVKGNNTLFPSLGINGEGNGVIAFSLAGTDYFPSAAYVNFSGGSASRFIHVAGAGQDPEDGFSGYPQFLPPPPPPTNVGRWGDYSAAVADGNRIWFAAEYIPKACAVNALPCRTSLANWGTFVSTVRPQD
jgi:hypothetical protein